MIFINLVLNVIFRKKNMEKINENILNFFLGSNCNCKLNLATYKKVEGKLYCPTHVPVERKNVVGIKNFIFSINLKKFLGTAI